MIAQITPSPLTYTWKDALYDAIALLSEKQQTVICLYYGLNGLSSHTFPAIDEILELRPGSAKYLCHRARHKLYRLLTQTAYFNTKGEIFV